jgi:two-component system nitrogen regulation response regulator NtrX
VTAERVLVVDDEPGVRSALEAILADEGFDVTSVESGEDGLEALDRGSYDAVLLDVWLPGIDGLDTLRRMREMNHDVEVVMISGHGTIDTAVRATKFGAFDFVEKPLSLDRTLLVLRNALRQRRLQRSNRQLLEQLTRDTEIVGNSAAAVELREMVQMAAAADAPVLICGERGSGRETVARRIHAAGRRPDGPFVEIPCAALDAQAADRALSGGPGGRLALAERGSLFLEDVGRLDDEIQLRLAATLLARTKDGADIRVMASAPPDAAGMVQELRQVLDVIRVEVPSLRKRREDIELLAERFMLDLSREYGRSPKQLAPDSRVALKTYDWPGNVRELWNLMERVLLLVTDEVVRAEDLPEGFGGIRGPAEDLYRDFESLAEGLEVFERYYVRRVMAQENGNAEAAAAKLGLRKDELERRLKGR